MAQVKVLLGNLSSDLKCFLLKELYRNPVLRLNLYS